MVSTASLAPVTGGASAILTGFLWAGALASSGQCAASAYRLTNVYRGRTDINQRLDNSPIYVNVMRGADVVGLVGAGGALKELKVTSAVLHAEGLTFREAAAGPISRPVRRRLTALLELEGGKRLPAHVINSVVRKKLLDGFAGVVGLAASGFGGIGSELIAWITSEADRAQ